MLKKNKHSSRAQRNRNTSQHPENPKEEKKLLSTLPETMNLTSAVLSKYSHIEFSKDNQEAIVEGCTGIIEYNDNVIRLNTPKFILRFTGRNLQVSCMTEDSIIVRGFILSMEFLN